MLNCYILYKKQNPGSKTTHLNFVVRLIARLIEQYGSETPPARRGRPSKDAVVDPLRLSGRHFLKEIPPTEQKLRPTRQCSHADEKAKKKRGETRYYCEDCNVGLCLSPCFERYHKRVKY